MTVEQETDDVIAIAALQELIEQLGGEGPLQAAIENGDEDALNILCTALPAIRRKAGLSLAEFAGRDLAEELGLGRPIVQ